MSKTQMNAMIAARKAEEARVAEEAREARIAEITEIVRAVLVKELNSITKTNPSINPTDKPRIIKVQVEASADRQGFGIGDASNSSADSSAKHGEAYAEMDKAYSANPQNTSHSAGEELGSLPIAREYTIWIQTVQEE